MNARFSVAIPITGLGLALACEEPNEPSAPVRSVPKPLLSVATNEPSGFFVLTDWPMDSVVGGGWSIQSQNNNPLSVVPDSTTPGSQPNVAEWRHTAAPDGAPGRSQWSRGI